MKPKNYKCVNCSKKITVSIKLFEEPRCMKCGIFMQLQNKQPAPVAVVEAAKVTEQKGLF